MKKKKNCKIYSLIREMGKSFKNFKCIADEADKKALINLIEKT